MGQTVRSTCETYGTETVYTGVSPEGETRECARCGKEVEIQPLRERVVVI